MVYGDQFYAIGAEKAVRDFFIEVHLGAFRKAIESARSALKVADSEEQRQQAINLGHLAAKERKLTLPSVLSSSYHTIRTHTLHRIVTADNSVEETTEFLKQLAEQLPVLSGYLEEQFAPTYVFLWLVFPMNNTVLSCML